jgi:hypothetical protein
MKNQTCIQQVTCNLFFAIFLLIVFLLENIIHDVKNTYVKCTSSMTLKAHRLKAHTLKAHYL